MSTKETNKKIIEKVETIKNLLLEKNTAYGDSAISPINVFNKLSGREAICVRIDDKLSRIRNSGITDKTEDTLTDLIGYLILLQISIDNERTGHTLQTDNNIPESINYSQPPYIHNWVSSQTNS